MQTNVWKLIVHRQTFKTSNTRTVVLCVKKSRVFTGVITDMPTEAESKF